MVTDFTGIAITGAAVVTEDSPYEWRTDSQGIAAIPCRSMQGTIQMLKVSAPGYEPTQVTYMPDGRSMFEVRLDRREQIVKGAGNTVNASELKPDVKKQSAQLQKDAVKALEAEDYDSAERLLLDALQLTPSEALIANNLGVIALQRGDLEAASGWFQMAAAAAPYRWDIQGNLGMVLWMLRQPEEGYRILSKAFANGYESKLGHYILGTVGLEMGRNEEAVAHLKKVPSDRFPYRDLYLSIALRNRGQLKAAEETYRDFLRRNPVPYMVASLR